MKIGFLFFFLLINVGIVFAESGSLMTEDGQTLTTEDGGRILVGNGTQLDLRAYVKSKSGMLEYAKDGKMVKIKIPEHADIELTKKASNLWAPIYPSADSKIFDVWSVKVSISNSLPNAEVSLEGCGGTFTTNSHGEGVSLFYVDATPRKHSLRIVKLGGNELSADINLLSAATAKCSGKRSLHCDLENN
jgi:hypothetical protein